MKQIRIPIKGIKRNNPQGTEDGACDDLINMRFIKNAWRPLAPKVELYPENSYTLQRIHTDDGIDNWIGYLKSTEAIDYFDPADGTVIQSILTLNGTEELNDILFSKRIMIIVTTENSYKFYLKDDLYARVNLTGIESLFNVVISKGDVNPNTLTDEAYGDSEIPLANWYRFLNEASADGYNHGGIFYRTALKMFDGNYIMHSSPKYHQFESNEVTLNYNLGTGNVTFELYSAKILASLTYNPTSPYDSDELEGIKSFIQSVVIFASKAEGLFELDDRTMNQENYVAMMAEVSSDIVNLSEQSTIGINPDFKTIGDSPSWYQIAELPLTDLKEVGISQENIMTLTGASGTALISGAGGLSRTITFTTSLTDTATDFVTSFAADYLVHGIIVTSIGNNIYFKREGAYFTSPIITNTGGDLSGYVYDPLLGIPGTYTGDFTMDLEGFYQNYSTRTTLTVDDFSHHELTGNASYSYNDRLMLGDTKQRIALPNISGAPASLLGIGIVIGTDTYNYKESIAGKVEVILSTTNGDKIVTQDISYRIYDNAIDPLDIAVILESIVSYPDSRGKEIIFHIYDGATLKELFRTTLTKSLFYNFSYFRNESYDMQDVVELPFGTKIGTNNNYYPITFTMAGLPASTLLTQDRIISDGNRWATSEVNNPLLFKNENSNQVGIGKVIAFGTNTELIGTSQFGQFPIIIFMSTGRWIAEVGLGDVYITNIVPLDRDVIRDKDAKLDLAFGVVYITAEGLKVAQGKQVTEISEPVEGYPDLNFIDNADFKYFANNEHTVQMIDYLDKVDFLTYLEGAQLGYNKNFENSELIIANPDYLYAYVYDLTSQTWYKFAEKIYQFIPSYPTLYAMSEKRAGISAPYTLTKRILNISSEEAGNTQCMVVTRALTMGLEDVFKKLHRTFIRGYFKTKIGTYAAAYIFSSDDLKNWQFVTGNDMNTMEFNNIWLTHSKGSSRYYVIVFLAELDVDHQGIINRLSSIDVSFQEKRNQKLR